MRIKIYIIIFCLISIVAYGGEHVIFAVKQSEAASAKTAGGALFQAQYGTNFLKNVTNSENPADWKAWALLGWSTYQLKSNTNTNNENKN